MPKLTLAQARPIIAKIIHVDSTDSRVVDYIDEAQRLLLDHGDWMGMIAPMQISITDGLVTWPRDVERVDKVAACQIPMPMRNQWYEFLEWGDYGLQPDDFNCQQPASYERQSSPLVSDIVGTDKVLRVVFADPVNDVGKTIRFQGKDENSSRIYDPNATGYPGETVTCPVGGTVDTTNYFSSVESALKDATKGYVRLYEYEPIGATARLIATYEPDETQPDYKRTLLDPFTNMGPDTTTTGCTTTTKVINALVKRGYRKAVQDTDYLMISSLQALKLAVQGILKQENNLFDEGEMYIAGKMNPFTKSRQGGAIGQLQAQQKAHDGHTVSIRQNPHGTAHPRLRGIGYII